jgi:hypothetical protein
MILKNKPKSTDGSKRFVKRFAWTPERIDPATRVWLQWYVAEEMYSETSEQWWQVRVHLDWPPLSNSVTRG